MTPEAMEKKEMLKREMQKLLNVLCDREQNVLRLHYGFNGCTPWSFEEIGNLVLELATRNKKNIINSRHVLFGEGCHFLHYVPSGIKAVTQMLGNNPTIPPAARNLVVPPSFPDGSSSPAVKSRLCNKYNTAGGCKFGDKCHFANGEWELGKPTVPSHEDPRAIGQILGRYGGGRIEPTQPVAASFGASAIAKIKSGCFSYWSHHWKRWR